MGSVTVSGVRVSKASKPDALYAGNERRAT